MYWRAIRMMKRPVLAVEAACKHAIAANSRMRPSAQALQAAFPSAITNP